MGGEEATPLVKKDLYEVLGLSRDATSDQIKKAYRKLAMQTHPDKNNGDDTRFKEISHAYSILSDEEKKKIYDQYGEEGLTTQSISLDDLITQLLIIPPQHKCQFICTLFVFLVILLIFPLFIFLRSASVISWSWFVIFIPFWIFDAIWFIYLLIIPCSIAMIQAENKGALWLGYLLQLVLFVINSLAAIFLCLQLDGDVHWSYHLVMTPIYIYEGLTLLTVFRGGLSSTLQAIFWKILRVSFFVMLACHFDGGQPPWGVVIIPLWIGAVAMLVSLLLSYLHYKKMIKSDKLRDATFDPDRSRYAPFLFKITAVVELSLVLSLFIFSLYVCGVGRLHPVDVGIPFFLGLGLAFLLMSMGICYGGTAVMRDDEEEESGNANNSNEDDDGERKKNDEYGTFGGAGPQKYQSPDIDV